MISRKIKSDDLIGRKCRPIHSIKNGAGNCIGSETICTIVSAHYGVTVKTDECPYCGQSAYISRISREELELVENVPSRGRSTYLVVAGGEHDGATAWYECEKCHGGVDISDRFCKHCGAKIVGLKPAGEYADNPTLQPGA